MALSIGSTESRTVAAAWVPACMQQVTQGCMVLLTGYSGVYGSVDRLLRGVWFC